MKASYQDFINECWSNHDKESNLVANNLISNLDLIETTEQIPGYVSLVTHTFGGHLGKWSEAIELLKNICELKAFKNNQAVYRGLATMSYCLDDENEFNKYVELSTQEGRNVKIYAVAATELIGQGDFMKATMAFNKALAHAPENMEKDNPCASAIAISGNNLACELEEKPNRSDSEVELMLIAAKAARKYWEIAGGWTEVERAEYRLAMSYLQANDPFSALEHARLCESICKENNANPFESFFAYEALTKVNRALCKEFKSKVKPEFQSYCAIP
ncbi:hypothetical protein HOF92_00400 [bacterium]|jgi:hypothetical protein|nr:hypothetical protein [bacterium]